MPAADEFARIDLGKRRVPVEIFRPTTSPAPALVVIHELYGLNDDIRRISRRFADEGFLAAAPDLLVTGRIRCLIQVMQELRSGSGPMVNELEALIGKLDGRECVTKVGAVGFCMGGGFALLLGTRQSVSVAGVYYGDTRTREELERVCPVMGGYGAKDRSFASKGRELIRTLEELGKEHDVRMYDRAGHSFMNEAGHPFLEWLSRPVLHVRYDEELAEDSWRRMLAFFRKYLS